MDAMVSVPATNQRSLPELIHDANDLHERITHTKTKIDDLEVELGLTLEEAKTRKPKRTTWPAFVKKHFDFGKSRADELIRIAKGKTTVEKVREGKRESTKKSRAKRPPRGGQNKRTKPMVTSFPEVGLFHHELMTFIDGFCLQLQEWFEKHPQVTDEGRASLMQALELGADRLQRLAQALDGR